MPSKTAEQVDLKSDPALTMPSDTPDEEEPEQEDQVTSVDGVRKIGGLVIHTPEVTMKDSGSFWILYGQGGSGKTTLAGSAEDNKEFGAPLLHIDIEGGVDAIYHRKTIGFVEVNAWREWERLLAALKKGNHGYKTIVLDNLSELVDMCLTGIAGDVDQVEIQEYGEMTRKIVYAVRELRKMSKAQGINVIICAWDADERDDRNVLKKELALTPKLREKIPGIVTTIGHVQVLNDPNQRILNFAPSPKTVSKFRRSGEANSLQIPFKIQYGLGNLPMSDLLNVVRGGGKWPEAKYKVDKKNADNDSDSTDTSSKVSW